MDFQANLIGHNDATKLLIEIFDLNDSLHANYWLPFFSEKVSPWGLKNRNAMTSTE